MMAEDLLSKLESLDGNEEAHYFDNESDSRVESTVDHLFTGGFAHQVGILAARSKDIIGKKFYKCVKYSNFFNLKKCLL